MKLKKKLRWLIIGPMGRNHHVSNCIGSFLVVGCESLSHIHSGVKMLVVNDLIYTLSSLIICTTRVYRCQ